jgi:hypothetical protein
MYFFVCKFLLYYCHRVSTQLQLTNISYHIKATKCPIIIIIIIIIIIVVVVVYR